MNRVLVTTFGLWLAVAPSSPGQGVPIPPWEKPGYVDPATLPKNMVYLRVQRMLTKLNANTSWWTDWGSYYRRLDRFIVIEITLRNMMTTQQNYVIGWFFIARKINSGQLEVFGRGQRSLDMAAGETVTAAAASPELPERDANYNALGIRVREGGRIEGYVVIVKSGDRLIAQSASAPHLDQLAASLSRGMSDVPRP